MSRHPTPRTIAIRDQVLAILRDAHPAAVSTPEVLLAVANGGAACNSYQARRGDGGCWRGWGQHPLARCMAYCWHGAVYPQLRALAALGFVEHVPEPQYRYVSWRYVQDDQSDAYFNKVLEGTE